MDHNTASGAHESHLAVTVHLCPKCRWPFPNPHPSAKQRRAHKRVCGTIQGYELDTDMEPTLSDDDHNQTPSPKLVKEKGDCEKTSGGIRERPNRSEDELFSDAVTEFSDSGFSPGVEERPKDFKVSATGDKDLFLSFKDNAADLTEPSCNSTVSSQIENPELHENATALPGDNLVSQVHVSSTTEESAGEDVREGLMTYVGQETDAKESSKINPDGSVVPLLAYEYPDPTSEAESNCQGTEKMTKDLLPASEVVLSKEEHNAEMASKICSGDPMPGVEPSKLSDAVDTTQNIVGAEQGLNFTIPVNSNEGFSVKEGNESVYELSVPSIPVVENAEEKLEGFRGHKGVKLHQPVTLDNENFYELSVPADIPVVDHGGTMIEGFKDHKGVKLHQLVTLDSSEFINDKKVYVEDHLNEVSSKVSASDVHAMEDILSMPVVGKPSSIEENDEPQFKHTSKEGSDELGVSAAAITIGTEKTNVVSSMENQQSSDISDDSLHMVVQKTAVKVLDDVNLIDVLPEANIIGLHETVDHEYLTSETRNVIDKDEKERLKEEYFAENIITNSYMVTDPSQFQDNPATNLDGSDDAGDREKAKIEKCGVKFESKEEQKEPSEGKLLGELKTASESENNLHTAQVVAEDVRDASVIKLSETKLTNVDGFSETLDVPKQLEVNGSDKAQGDFHGKHGRDVDSIERTSVDHENKASLLSPSNNETSMQGSVAVDDNHAVEQVTGHSDINQSSWAEDVENNMVSHQIGASVIDVSVDSLSQTDSLEGNWGSISVLSTQSDIPAVTDVEKLSTDNLATSEAKQLNLNKTEGGTQRQNSEKSDVFEAPSFMTLVEPGSRSDEKASASDMQTAKNPQQQNLSKAGWFPSLTNVVNDSQGRKKNEARIAKVTNWSAGKQHTPLKNLLGEAYLETKPKSPNPKENKAHVIQKDERASKDNGAEPMTVGAILSPEAPAAEPAKRATEKEVDSPGRYQTDIKREKRKVKGRPYWAQFVCCSSVN